MALFLLGFLFMHRIDGVVEQEEEEETEEEESSLLLYNFLLEAKFVHQSYKFIEIVGG